MNPQKKSFQIQQDNQFFQNFVFNTLIMIVNGICNSINGGSLKSPKPKNGIIESDTDNQISNESVHPSFPFFGDTL